MIKEDKRLKISLSSFIFDKNKRKEYEHDNFSSGKTDS